MKLSKYNFFYDFEGEGNQKLAFNARTNALALLDKESYDALMEYAETGAAITDEELLLGLKSGGYLLEENIDEMDLIRLTLQSSRYSTDSLGMTIAPTLSCNFGCIYCYEKDNIHNSTMSQEVQSAIISILEKKADTINSFNISWYGGEPLLAMDTIENISEKAIKLCEEKKINYSAGIVTNGYLLNRETAEKLASLKVSFMQVTLDGPAEIHDQRRPLKGGQATFDTIIKNIAECADIIQNIVIRINTDKNNLKRINEILDVLDSYGLKQKVGAYLGMVEPTNDCYMHEKCLSKLQFSRTSLGFSKILRERGFKYNMMQGYPYSLGNFCGADTPKAMVIDPEGYIYNCWCDIGMKELSSGNIVKGGFEGNLSRVLGYIVYDPTYDPECSKCSFLPICMGGCPNRRLEETSERCSVHKYSLDQYLGECAAALYEESQKGCSTDGCSGCADEAEK